MTHFIFGKRALLACSIFGASVTPSLIVFGEESNNKAPKSGVVTEGIESLPSPLSPAEVRAALAPSKKVTSQPAEAQPSFLSTSTQAKAIASTPSQTTGNTEIIEQRYPNGAIMLEREVAQDAEGNYINHGLWRLRDQSGKLMAEGACRDNQLHGHWRRIFNGTESKLFTEAPFNEFKGPYISATTFENGRHHGVWTITDHQGRKISEIHYESGRRHGLARTWYANGKQMSESSFSHGNLDGQARSWSADGSLISDENYEAGRKLVTKLEHYGPFVKKSEIRYWQRQVTDKIGDNWWKATLAKYDGEGELEKHGTATYWHQNGQKRLVAEYRNGQLQGTGTWWHANGQLAAKGSFQDGKAHDAWTWWHANGQKSASGVFEGGSVAGLWMWWHEDGRLKARVADASQAKKSELVNFPDPARNLLPNPEVVAR